MYANNANRGYYYPNHLALGQELRRAREALLERYADRVEVSAVYVGYSQGASMGVLAIAEHGDWFPRMLLVEGGFENWSGALAKRYADTGGRRVLFVCGTEHCRKLASIGVTLLKQHRVQAQLRFSPGAGHRPDGPVTEQVRNGLAWLLAEGAD
jgi:predicted esterase